MRLLLHNKPGAVSFEDLRCINGEPEPTFQQACYKMGLLESDDELDRVLEECSSIRFGDQLRDVFANVLIYCRPSNPLGFWERHKDSLSQDYLRGSDLEQPNEEMYNRALVYLQERFALDGLDLVRNFNLPAVREEMAPRHAEPRVIRDEMSYDQAALAETLQSLFKLQEEQVKHIPSIYCWINFAVKVKLLLQQLYRALQRHCLKMAEHCTVDVKYP